MYRYIKNFLLVLTISLTVGCSALAGVAADKVLGSASGGIEATAQVGKENNKGMVNAKLDQTKNHEIDEVSGDANFESGNTTNNDLYAIAALMLVCFLPLLSILFWVLPVPKWITRRHTDNTQ